MTATLTLKWRRSFIELGELSDVSHVVIRARSDPDASSARPIHPLAAGGSSANAVLPVVRQEMETRDRSIRVSQPSPQRSPADGQCDAVRRLEALDPTTRRRRVANDEQSADVTDSPATICSHCGREPSLPIQAVQRRLRVRDDRLHLDDEDAFRHGVKREDVDRAALAPDREGRLDLDGPSMRCQPAHHGLDEPRVVLVEEPVELLASKPETEIDVGTEGRCSSNDRTDRHPRELPTIDRGDQRSRQAGPDRDVSLAPT